MQETPPESYNPARADEGDLLLDIYGTLRGKVP
jgi:hypothetical protein